MKNIFFLFLIIPSLLLSQKFTLSGYISDQSTGEQLFGVSIYEKADLKGTTTNPYGFYSITLPKGEYNFVFSYIGFKQSIKHIVLDKDIEFDIDLENSIEIDAVTVRGEKSIKVHETSKTSTINIPIAQIESLPNIGGEVDIIKAIQMLPGVQSGSEGSAGLYVRGGSPDQNLILLDGVPVYNPSHLFGFISVFNSNAISSVELIKGGFPARFGGRLSSVLDIRMKEGNNKEFHGDFTFGLLSSRLTFEGPIIKNKTSFIISARRSYMDLFMRPIAAAASKAQGRNGSTGYAFTDINAKINHKLTKKDKIFLSLYFGNDAFDATTGEDYKNENTNYVSKQKSYINYGNITSAFRYNHQFSSKLFLNTTATFSQYKFVLGQKLTEKQTNKVDTTENHSSDIDIKYSSRVQDLALQLDFDFLPHPNHFVKFGINGIRHNYTPGVSAYTISQENFKVDTTVGKSNTITGEISAYIEDDLKLGKRVKINIGGRASILYVGTKKYWSLEPRISANYNFLPKWSLKGSYSTMTQYSHLLSNSGIGLPTDLWVPVTEKIKPQRSWQAAGGLAYTLLDQYEFSVEGYYKEMTGLIEYKPGASYLFGDGDWENKVYHGGKGNSYGAEFFVHKKKGKFNGWVGYTLSFTNRSFKEINNGKPYSYKYDRRHDLSIALMYKLGPKIDFSATWVYGTGNAVTIPESIYTSANGESIIYDYGEKNGSRMPAYHRLDLGVNFRKKMKKGESIWNISVYNAYNRKNPFYIYLGRKKEDFTQKTYKQISLFPILPSFSYRRKF